MFPQIRSFARNGTTALYFRDSRSDALPKNLEVSRVFPNYGVVNENQQAAGKHLAEVRGGIGWTQKQLAEKSGVTERSISSFENGDTWPRAGTRAKLEKALGLTAGYFSTFAEGPTSSVAESEFTKRYGHLIDGKMPQAQTVINAFSDDLDPDDPDAFGILAERLKGISAATKAAMEFGELVKSGEESPRDVKYRPVFKDGKFDYVEVVSDSPETEKAGEGHVESPTPIKQAGGKPATGEDDGLGTFGGRARGDLDHEATNDGAGDNVHPLRSDLDSMAAYDTGNETEKQRLDREAEERDQGSQDPGDDWA